MAIHWQVKCTSLRSETQYTVNVYDEDYNGNPVLLEGAADTFFVQEDDADDFFAPVVTQTGYLNIIDTGYAVDGVTPFDWRDFVPQTDTDRAVTLTHEHNGVTVTDWIGYIQAQDFGSKLFDLPQERSFPVHCALSVMSRMDIGVQACNGIKNFAALLKYAIDSLPTISIDHIHIRGGADARAWLMKKFDWSLFTTVQTDDDYLMSNCDILKAVSHMCRYWGWTARMYGNELYLCCVDDSSYVNWLDMTAENLSDLANGNGGAGTISDRSYTNIDVDVEFANNDNSDMDMRGPNTAILTSSSGEVDENIIYAFPNSVGKNMNDGGYIEAIADKLAYTRDLLSFSTPLISGICDDSLLGASFNIMRESLSVTYYPVIRIKKVYSPYGYCTIQSNIHHCFVNGELALKADIYHGGSKIEAYTDFGFGSRHMLIRVGVGADRLHAAWWNGDGWGNSMVSCYAKIGGSDGYIYTCASKTELDTSHIHKVIPMQGKSGYLYIDFLGADESIKSDETVYDFEIADLKVTYSRPDDIWRFNDKDRKTDHEYKAKNNSVVKDEWSDDVMFMTDNYSAFGPGLVINANNSYFDGWDYQNHQSGTTKPEQHMADRVAGFWSQSHRRIECNLRKDLLAAVTPETTITIDDAVCYPVGISHYWSDDMVHVVLMEC